MKRISKGALVALLVFGLVSSLAIDVAGAAPREDTPTQAELDAQCFPSSVADYPPLPPDNDTSALALGPGNFQPGGRGIFKILNAIPGKVYCGNAYSTPIKLPATAADAQGALNYNVAVPADFELNAMHHIDIFRRHVKVGNFDFCVNKKGDISPTSACGTGNKPGGSLPKTGQDHLLDLLRMAIVLLGVGAGAQYLRRRRIATQRTA